MNLTFKILTATNSIIEARFSDDLEMDTMVTYQGRRVRLSKWKASVVETAMHERHDIERCFADARSERNQRTYAY